MTKTLTMEESTAKSLYKTANSEVKTWLEDNFGKKFFIDNIMDRIKDLFDVRAELKISDKEYYENLPYKNAINKEQRSINALYNIKLIERVFAQGWVIDFNNKNQAKYYPYFEKGSGRWGLYDYDYIYYRSHGSPAYFEKSEIATYAGKQFIEVYKEYLHD